MQRQTWRCLRYPCWPMQRARSRRASLCCWVSTTTSACRLGRRRMRPSARLATACLTYFDRIRTDVECSWDEFFARTGVAAADLWSDDEPQCCLTARLFTAAPAHASSIADHMWLQPSRCVCCCDCVAVMRHRGLVLGGAGVQVAGQCAPVVPADPRLCQPPRPCWLPPIGARHAPCWQFARRRDLFFEVGYRQTALALRQPEVRRCLHFALCTVTAAVGRTATRQRVCAAVSDGVCERGPAAHSV